MTRHAVYLENLRTIQAGLTNGVSPDVARDVGYLTDADEAAVHAEVASHIRQAERLGGSVMGATIHRLPVNHSVLEARRSVRGFYDSASVDRPGQRLEPYQPLSPEQIARNRAGLEEARAASAAAEFLAAN